MLLSEIKLNEQNPRTISDAKFKKLTASIKRFPKMLSLRPIVVDAEGVVLGGNMRLRALQALGYKEVPNEWVRVADNLTEEERGWFVIEDNVEFGEWDFDMLANEYDLDVLKDLGVDVPTMNDARIEINEDVELKDEKSCKNKCPKCGFEF